MANMYETKRIIVATFSVRNIVYEVRSQVGHQNTQQSIKHAESHREGINVTQKS